MASSKANGASALLGVVVDAPSDLYAVGRPGIDMTVTTPPAGGGFPPTASVGSGNLTGSFAYRIGFGTPDGTLTSPAPPVMTIVAAPGTPIPAQNDLAAAGTSGSLFPNVYTLVVTTAGATDEFDWSDLYGNTGTAVSMVAATPVALGSDVVEATSPPARDPSLVNPWTLTAPARVTKVTSKKIVFTTTQTGAGAT